MRLFERRFFPNSKRLDIPSLDANMWPKKLNIVEEPPNNGQKLWMQFVEKWPIISQPLALLTILMIIWTVVYCILPEYAGLDSTIMRFVYLFVGAEISGILVTFIKLPDMLGMLFWGVFYTYLGLANFTESEKIKTFLRDIALTVIMLLAGLGLELNSFKKVWAMIMRLTIVPSFLEVAITAALANLFLGMPWLWGLLLGFLITAISPNVVVTVMLALKQKRLGLNNGIHTLIYANMTCSDVLAIFLFGVVLAVIFSTGSQTNLWLQGPVGIGIGIVFGYVYGLLLIYLPSKKSKYVNSLRFVLTVLGGIISVIGSKYIEYPSAGALSCVLITLVSQIGWKKQPNDGNNSSVENRLDLLWKFLKPISFSLVGIEINFNTLEPSVVGYGTTIVLIGSLFRLIASYLSTFGNELTWKERLYVSISSMPKASVQATLGPVALDLARFLNNNDLNLKLANDVLVISVLAIILTAPVGAVLMVRLAPLWLKSSSSDGLTSGNVIEEIENQSATETERINRTEAESGNHI